MYACYILIKIYLILDRYISTISSWLVNWLHQMFKYRFKLICCAMISWFEYLKRQTQNTVVWCAKVLSIEWAGKLYEHTFSLFVVNTWERRWMVFQVLVTTYNRVNAVESYKIEDDTIFLIWWLFFRMQCSKTLN